MSAPGLDEQLLLRVPPALAARLRRILATAGTEAETLDLRWDATGRQGTLSVGADSFACKLLDLPTKVETWKSLGAADVVKSADVGQVVLVAPPGGFPPPKKNAPEHQAEHGLTVAMRDVVLTHFRKPGTLEPARLTAVETQLVKLITTGTHGGESEVSFVEEHFENGAWKSV